MEEQYFDTSIILEPFSKELKSGKKEYTFQRYCRKLLSYSVGKTIKPVISIMVLGEINSRLRRCKKTRIFENAVREIESFIDKCRILPIKPEAFKIANEVLTENPRLRDHSDDVFHFAIAMSNKVPFWSIERGIIGDRVIKKISDRLGVRVINEEDLIKEAD